MPIDINGLPPASPPPSGDKPRVKEGHQAPGTTSARAGDVAQTDTVSLTDEASRLAELERTLANIPVVDAKRVEEIKQAVSDGSYRVDPVRVADKLSAFESALPTKPKT